jgi:hypothetical protein
VPVSASLKRSDSCCIQRYRARPGRQSNVMQACLCVRGELPCTERERRRPALCCHHRAGHRSRSYQGFETSWLRHRRRRGSGRS